MPTPPVSFLLGAGGVFRVGARRKEKQTNEQSTHQDSPTNPVRQDTQQHHRSFIPVGVASMAEQRPLLDYDKGTKATPGIQEPALFSRLAQSALETVGRLHRGPLGEQSETVEVAGRKPGAHGSIRQEREGQRTRQEDHRPTIISTSPELTPTPKGRGNQAPVLTSRKERKHNGI